MEESAVAGLKHISISFHDTRHACVAAKQTGADCQVVPHFMRHHLKLAIENAAISEAILCKLVSRAKNRFLFFSPTLAAHIRDLRP